MHSVYHKLHGEIPTICGDMVGSKYWTDGECDAVGAYEVPEHP
jgi:hypothetical protein